MRTASCFIILFITMALYSCAHPMNSTVETSDSTNVTFNIACPEAEVATRALDPSQEKFVYDLNIYLFHKRSDLPKHIYIKDKTSSITTMLVNGDYDLYVIANTGGNLGELTEDQVRKYSLDISDETDLSTDNMLPMSASQSITVNKDNTVIPVSLVRMTAKVVFSLTIAPGFSSMVMIRLRMV